MDIAFAESTLQIFLVTLQFLVTIIHTTQISVEEYHAKDVRYENNIRQNSLKAVTIKIYTKKVINNLYQSR